VGDALYADVWHMGVVPLRQSWVVVILSLLVNYFGQGAYLFTHAKTGFILFEMVKSFSEILFIPFLLLTMFATVIASQAMISAVMSLVYQGITTHVFPLMKIKYTSSHIKSQIYIGVVNWVLLISVLCMILFFRKSENLAAAYGLAVTATMTISGMLMIWIFRIRKFYYKMFIALFVFVVDLIFLISVFTKIPHGGFWSLVIAAVPLFVITVWGKGNRKMYRSFRALPIDTFTLSYEQIYGMNNNIKGTALFFTRSLDEIPPYIVHCMIRGNIIYENNILISIRTTDNPYGIKVEKKENLAKGLEGIIISTGYMEILQLSELLKEQGITEKVIFYGVEDILTNNFF